MEDKPLLDFGRARRVKGRGFYIPMSVMDRARAARGVKQAVVKAVSYAHAKTCVQALIDYVSRKGKLVLETETGERITDREQAKALVSNWAIDFDRGKRSRDAVHLVFSMPPGSSVEALRKSVRKVGARAFSDQEWVFAIHENTKHPHAHMVVKMRGRQKDQKLRLNKPELYKLREVFAEAAREQGGMLAASSRAARGVGQKAQSRAIYQMHQKGIVPNVEKQAHKEIFSEIVRTRVFQEKPWEKAMRERNDRERKAYLEEAAKLRVRANEEKARNDQKLRQMFLSAAADLERFARTMPKPKSKRQEMVEKVIGKPPEKSKAREADNGLEL